MSRFVNRVGWMLVVVLSILVGLMILAAYCRAEVLEGPPGWRAYSSMPKALARQYGFKPMGEDRAQVRFREWLELDCGKSVPRGATVYLCDAPDSAAAQVRTVGWPTGWRVACLMGAEGTEQGIGELTYYLVRLADASSDSLGLAVFGGRVVVLRRIEP
jgi:hypothetical protein